MMYFKTILCCNLKASFFHRNFNVAPSAEINLNEFTNNPVASSLSSEVGTVDNYQSFGGDLEAVSAAIAVAAAILVPFVSAAC